MRLAVVALGGNAIADLGSDNLIDAVARLVGLGWDVVLTHGNGPQVGELLLTADARHLATGLDVLDAETQGALGYALQQSLSRALRLAGITRDVVSVITQVVVDAADPAFHAPAKPVGPFYDTARADALRAEKGWTLVEDAGRGHRRVVPSPAPLAIVEWPAIRALVSAHVVVVAAGGGGIPVVRDAFGALRGVDAVIDKDRASSLLARLLEADLLLILTGVDAVRLDFGRPSERALRRLSVSEARAHLAAGQFLPGSMGPKIEAAADFTEATGSPAVITSPLHVLDALAGTGGTTLHSGRTE
jgi:carbamate kinase